MRSGMKIETITFADLIRTKYLDAGFNTERWTAKVMIDTGVSRSALRAAFAGTRLKAETARNLTIWAAKTHHVDLDELQLVTAPTRAPRAKPRAQAEG